MQIKSGMNKLTTINKRELAEQLKYEFAKQCGYTLNDALEIRLAKPASEAAILCEEMGVDPATYVAAQIYAEPVIKNYSALIPRQLYTYRSKNYVTDYIASKGDRDVAREFEVQCQMLARYMDNGWTERLCLLNPSFDFSSWFRILLCTDADKEIIERYSYNAAQTLNNDKPMLDYLKTIKSETGATLDFKRIPDLKL